MSINIEEEKSQKEKNFKEGLEGFLEEHQSLLDNPNNFKRHSKNCGNQGRSIAEAFCRYIILSSSEADGRKRQDISGNLSNLIDAVARKTIPFIQDESEREILKRRLKQILDYGNKLSHDNDFTATTHDIEELRTYLYYLASYANINIEKKVIKKSSSYEKNITKSISGIKNTTLEISLGNGNIEDSIHNIENSSIKIS
jgi:hypothetical protein